MTAEGEQCSNVSNGQIVSGEGFTQKMAASVTTRNCLSGGVHPNVL